jgi:hypothetical protein
MWFSMFKALLLFISSLQQSHSLGVMQRTSSTCYLFVHVITYVINIPLYTALGVLSGVFEQILFYSLVRFGLLLVLVWEFF